jgi:hypothetical protein
MCGSTCCSASPPAECAAGRCLTTLASGQADPMFIAVDTTSVYWTNLNGGTVMKLTPK